MVNGMDTDIEVLSNRFNAQCLAEEARIELTPADRLTTVLKSIDVLNKINNLDAKQVPQSIKNAYAKSLCSCGANFFCGNIFAYFLSKTSLPAQLNSASD